MVGAGALRQGGKKLTDSSAEGVVGVAGDHVVGSSYVHRAGVGPGAY